MLLDKEEDELEDAGVVKKPVNSKESAPKIWKDVLKKRWKPPTCLIPLVINLWILMMIAPQT